MSLINDMLRDLDQRLEPGGTVPGSASGITASGEGRRRSRVVFGCLMTGCLLVGLLLFFYLSGDSGFFGATPKTIAPELASGPSVALPPLVPVSEETLPAPVTLIPPPEENTAAELVAVEFSGDPGSAHVTLEFSGLTEYRFEQQETAGRQFAFRFPQAVIGRQLHIPDSQDDHLLAQFSLRPGADSLLLLMALNSEGRVDAIRAGQLADDRFRITIGIARSAPLPVQEPSVAVAAATPAKPLADHRPAPAEKIETETPKLDKSVSPVAPDIAAYRLGLAQVKDGAWSAARASFRRAIALRPDFVGARVQLAALLQQQKQLEAAAQVVGQGLELAPENPVLRKLSARLMLASQRYSEGVSLLSATPQPAFEEDQEYHALLAVLLQEDGRYQDAGKIYRRLVTLQPGNETWWFGLGVCADQSDNRSLARQAYGTALNLPALRGDLRDYAQRRLQKL